MYSGKQSGQGVANRLLKDEDNYVNSLNVLI